MKPVAPSQLTSGVNTPRRDDDVFDASFSSPLYSSQLQERLRLLRDEGAEKPHHGFNKNRFVHSIEVLGEDRRKTSELAREQALGTLLTELVTKYDPELINYELFSTIVNSFLTARTDVEATTALQLITAAVTLTEGNESDPRIDECLELVHQLLPTLLKRIGSAAPAPDVKAAMATTFAVLSYFLNAGGGGYGMERVVSSLMEIAEGVSSDDDAPLAASALNGAALITTLTSRGSINEVVGDWLFSLVPMLEVQPLAPKLAATKVVAVFFELADAAVLQSGDNREAADEIVDVLDGMTQESISRTARKDKKAQNLLVKSVLKLCRHKLRGAADAAGDADTDEDVSSLVSQYHKHTLSKSVGVTTWASLVVVEHLRWVFGPGLHSQLANNSYIISLLRREDVRVEAVRESEGDEPDAGPSFGHDAAKHSDAAKRARELRKQQLRKAEDRGLADETA